MKNVIINNEIINNIRTEVERIVKATIKEYEIFEEFQLNQDAKTLFGNAYYISSINDLYYFFVNSGFSDMIENNITLYQDKVNELNHMLNGLQKMTDNVLENLYSSHFDYEALYTNLWEDIELLIKYVYFNEII